MVLVEPQVSGFKIENGYLTYTDEVTPVTDLANPSIIEPEKDIPYYQIYFHAKRTSIFDAIFLFLVKITLL